MDALEILQILIRRWWAVIPVLALTVGGGLYLGAQQPIEYNRAMSVLVVGPAELTNTKVPVRTNPLRGIGLDTTAQAMVLVGESGPAHDAARAAGVAPTYDLSASKNSPIIKIEATGASPDGVIATLKFASEYVAAQLDQKQTDLGAPQENRITIETLDPPQGPVSTSSGARRIQIAIFGAGLLLAVLIAVIIDRILAAVRGGAGRSRGVAPSPRNTTVVARRSVVGAASGPAVTSYATPAQPVAPAVTGAVSGPQRYKRGERGADLVKVAGAPSGPSSQEPEASSDDAATRTAQPNPTT